MKFDLSRLENLVNLMEDQDLTELEVEQGSDAISIERLETSGRAAHKREPETTEITVTAARVGIYAGKVAVGAKVKVDEKLGEIRVMDVKYGVPSPVAGTVVEIFIEDAVAVEYGQPLLRIDPGQD